MEWPHRVNSHSSCWPNAKRDPKPWFPLHSRDSAFFCVQQKKMEMYGNGPFPLGTTLVMEHLSTKRKYSRQSVGQNLIFHATVFHSMSSFDGSYIYNCTYIYNYIFIQNISKWYTIMVQQTYSHWAMVNAVLQEWCAHLLPVSSAYHTLIGDQGLALGKHGNGPVWRFVFPIEHGDFFPLPC